MAVSDEDVAYALELFEGVGAELTYRKMMGGLSIYADGTIFAIIGPDERLYLKCQGDMIAEIEDLGGERWVYQKEPEDTPRKMPYWTLPESALDDPEEAATLARRALTYL